MWSVYQRTVGLHVKKNWHTERITYTCEGLKQKFQSSRREKYGVCKQFITKLTDYFFAIIDLGTKLFGNEPLITQHKENCRLIKCFGPMYIYFDEYPCYSGRNSGISEKYVNENIKCNHGYAYSAGQRNMCKWVNEDTW